MELKKMATLTKKIDYQAIISTGKPFSDSEFPPVEASIYNAKDVSGLDD